MSASKPLTIAIDGYSSTGKSTLAKTLAQQLNYAYIDTGAMYRAVALFALQNNFFPNEVLDQNALTKALHQIDVKFKKHEKYPQPVVYLNGICVEEEIRQMHVSARVSEVAAVKAVREKLVHLQQEMGKAGGVVMDGRDIGTVVFPNAELKIFMTANPEVRAIRRWEELRGKGEKVTLTEVRENLLHRDHLDTTRDESPLTQAPGALVLDNSNLTRDLQLEMALDWVRAVQKIER
jgi:cytidylate kinase